jgi:hypothetical protein
LLLLPLLLCRTLQRDGIALPARLLLNVRLSSAAAAARMVRRGHHAPYTAAVLRR